mgnify:CR=1 FL=1
MKSMDGTMQPTGMGMCGSAGRGGSLHKLAAVTQIKWLCISRNTMIMIGPLLVIGMVYACKILYGVRSEGTLVPFLTGMLLNIGISMNICADGFIMVGTSIAEEKENHTLRALMTSSITGVQYFFGSILIPFALLMAVNYIVLFISGISLEIVPWIPFFLVSAVASLTSCVLGMIVGICAKNHVGGAPQDFGISVHRGHDRHGGTTGEWGEICDFHAGHGGAVGGACNQRAGVPDTL